MPTIEAMEDLQHVGLCCPECAARQSAAAQVLAKRGAALWESCLQCGDLAAAGESYCGAAAPIVPRLPPISWNGSRPISAPWPSCRPSAASTMP